LLHFHAADGKTQRLDASTLPLGVLADPPVKRPRAFQLEPGDIIALISDGVFEYADPEGRQFGLEPVARLFAEHADQSADELIQRIRREVDQFARGADQGDDMTMVLVKRQA
jgi:serine phosphatase RsbU (regulator of sigma subunit)